MRSFKGVAGRLLSAFLLFAASVPGSADTSVLLVYASDDEASLLECNGIADALEEVGLPFQTLNLDDASLFASALGTRAAAVLCHLPLLASETQTLSDWVAAGGGLLVTGQSGLGLEAVLGLESLVAVSGDSYTELRFTEDHPAATGSWWAGPIMQAPPMPVAEIPSISRFYYIDDTQAGGWPSFALQAGQATALASWHDSDSSWGSVGGPVAVSAHQHGAGRVVYSGALAGAYANWDWPQTWRTFIVASLHWLGQQQPQFEIGLWPHGHRAAMTWTGDTEKPAMVTAVPALLDVFADLGLERFGTFYMVGRAGGDADTLGAQEHPEVVQAIAAAGSQLGGHGNIHTEFRGQSAALQQQRLQEMIDIINPLLAPYGERLRGFRAPYLSQDWATFQALAEVGLDYDAGEADVWSQTTLPHRLGPVWQIPPTMPMDYHLFEAHGLSTEEALILFQDKLDYVISRRGLFSWLHHPWVIEPHIELVRDLLAVAVARGDIWLTRQDDLLDWWIARQDIEIKEIEQRGRRFRLRLDNAGLESIEGVSIWVRRPFASADDWQAFIDGSVLPTLSIRHAGQDFLVVQLGQLAAGSETWLDIVGGDALFEDRFQVTGPP